MNKYDDRDTSAGICGTYSGIDFNLNNVRKANIKKNSKKNEEDIKPKEKTVYETEKVAEPVVSNDESSPISVEDTDKLTENNISEVEEDIETEETVSTDESSKPMIHNVTDGHEFKSMAEAERYYGLSSGSVSSSIKSGTEVNGMKFERY